MKALTVSVALLLVAGACHKEDTGTGSMWGRTIEPRLTTTLSWHSCTKKLSPGHAVQEAQCAAAPIDTGRCDDVIDSREQANRMLVSRPQCTSEAIEALERFSLAEPAAMSDLAGAYYVRAQRKDNPADLLRAFDKAQRAVSLKPQPEGAQFNLALILEALSMNSDAIEAWQRAALTERGEWADEARAHRSALMQRTAEDGEHQWERIRTQIDSAIDAHDASKTQQLIAIFPGTSQRYFEDDVLAQWAKAPSPQQLSRVSTFAEALTGFTHDRYFTDVAAAIANTRAPDRLRQAQLRYAEARGAQKSINFRSAAPLYAEAARLFQESGSPQCLVARIGHAEQGALVNDENEAARKELETVEADANRRQYPNVVARVNLNLINTYQFLSRYNELFAAYETAMTAYGRMGDWEDRAAASSRAIATMSVLGLKDAAWREAFVALRDTPRIVSSKTQHLLIGAAATAALDLDHPEAALLYQNVLVGNARRNGVPTYLVSALDHLAWIELSLRRYGDAQRHVDEAARENDTNAPALRRALDARLAQVKAAAALRIDPGRAVASLTEAIDAAKKPEYATFLAVLFAERAEAFARLGKPADAEADRREALRRLHEEEARVLRDRKPGEDDDRWNFYFSRFEETYDLLIRQLIGEGRVEEAFRVAERARAFEPLDLVRNLPTTPAAFRELAAQPDNLDISRLRALLPPGTLLIEYRVFDDKTYAWIVGRDVFIGQWLTARRTDVKRWTSVLQEAASKRDSAAFEDGLLAPYDGLLRAPLASVNRFRGGAGANIVIVPDRELRGLPFAALRNPDTRRYAVEDNVLSMSGSALLYVFSVLRDRDLVSGDASALLVGDPAFNPQSTLARGLQRLSFARKEIDEIRSFYPHPDVLMDGAATPQRFLHLASGSAIIHIAAHGVVNGEAPSQSFLLFNGLLNAQTLMKDLHTDKTRLVVLGACSSAGGLPVGAEGVAPLVRPIIGAGVPGVIGALWDIDDATAEVLLVSFHRHYRQGEDAA
ncbi:MAG TPA: CHAT domain-containing protein, partial [Thermoanaerobaculia bacterium]|nr:CHAT domain-containing protein [Thermoanaerobaculia bacterium]